MGLFSRVRGTLFPSSRQTQFDEETRFHFDELVDRFVAEGMPDDEARRAAARRLGNLTLARERTRDADTFRWITDAAQDFRFAVRTLGKSPSFTLVAALTLALGIGANTAMFTLFDAVLLRDLPVRDPARLVLFTNDVGEGTSTGAPPTGQWELFSMDAYRQLRDQPIGLDALAAVRSGSTAVLVHLASSNAGAARAEAHLVTGNYFSTLGVDTALGRALTPSDDNPAAAPAAVISDRYWRNKLRADPSIVGATAVLNKTAFTIVGVAPPEFFGERVRHPPDFWVPLAFQPQIELRPSTLTQPDVYWLELIGRLSPGANASEVQTAATTVLRRFLTSNEGATLTPTRARDIRDSYISLAKGGAGISGLRLLYSEPLHILLAVVGLLLLLACANVANLLLTRAAGRRSEIAMRLALGAGRMRLIRQLLTESLVLAALGAACGALIAVWASRALVSLIASPTSPVHATLSLPVLAFTAAIAAAAGLLFGIVPALQASRVDLVAAMKTRQGSGAAAGRGGVAQALVALQIALSLVLLVGALLFARTLGNLERQPLGFEANHVLLARVSPRLAGYAPPAATSMYMLAYDRLRTLPGVRSATFARYSPFSGANSVFGGTIEGYARRGNEAIKLETVPVGPSYPETLGMRLLQGREINDKDIAGTAAVAMVNEAFVRRYFPDSSPLGHHVGFDTARPPDVEIVGVLEDAQFHDPHEPVRPMVFDAMLQETSGFALDCEFAIRGDGDAGGAAAEVRQTLAAVDRNVPVNDPATLSSQVAAAFDSQRLAARFVSVFSLLALAIACVGLYGTVSQSVTQRTPEIGVRMALGAAPSLVLRMILRQTGVLVGIGLLAGIPLSLVAARLVARQLFGVRPIDPASLGGAVAVMIVVALGASLVPARRATRINAVQALRGD